MTYPKGMSPYELALWFTEKLGNDTEMERRNWVAAWWNLYREAAQLSKRVSISNIFRINI